METEISAKEYTTATHTSVMLLSIPSQKHSPGGVATYACNMGIGVDEKIRGLRPFLGYTEDYRKSQGNNNHVGS